jgi:hypothetical protein
MFGFLFIHPVHYVDNFKIVRTLTETRWIAPSFAPLFPRNDKDRVETEPHTPIPFQSCHREGEARGDPL